MTEQLASYTTSKPQQVGLALNEFLQQVSGVLKQGLPGAYWVRAEILKADKREHWSLELGSYDQGAQKAKARATIWASNRRIVERFEKATGAGLKQGFKILFLCAVQFHPEYGFSLNIQDIDSRFTLGDMQAKLQAIRDRLKSLGEIHLNRQLPVPHEFTRVAVIAPHDAAGLGDFRTEADRLQQHRLCEFEYFTAQFQGAEVVDSFVNAMSDAVSRHVSGTAVYDALVVIRGGGDKAGLYQLNEAKIARAVCRCPIPVFVGVGHERDKTILDELANQRFPTPSLVISHILSSIVKHARDARLVFEQMQTRCQSLLAYAKQDIQQCQGNLAQYAQRQLAHSQQNIARLRLTVVHGAETQLQNAKLRVKDDEQNVSTYASGGLNKARTHLYENHNKLLSSARTQQVTARNTLFQQKQQLHFSLDKKLAEAKSLVLTQQQNLIQQAESQVKQARYDVKLQVERVLFQDPQKILTRGFTLIKGEKDTPITRKVDLKPGQQVKIQFNDGEALASIED